MIKLLAFSTMLIDHSCIFFFPEYEIIMRSMGALSFPLFSFFIVQGLKFTKDLQLYIISLITCACVTQPLFNLLFPHLHRLNDLYTLLFGLLILVLYERYGYPAFYLTLLLVITNVVSIYIFIVFAIYFLHQRPVYLLASLAAFYLLVFYISGSVYVLAGPASIIFMYSKISLPLPRKVQKYFYYIAYPGHFLLIILLK